MEYCHQIKRMIEYRLIFPVILQYFRKDSIRWKYISHPLQQMWTTLSKYSLAFLIFFSLLAQTHANSVILEKFPVNRILSLQVETRLNRLRNILNEYRWQKNKQQIYLRARLCQVYLLELARQSKNDFQNLMAGSKNIVNGVNNIVMGSSNKVNGKGNWIFSANYDHTQDRVLVIDKWKIELDKLELIRVHPRLAISLWEAKS